MNIPYALPVEAISLTNALKAQVSTVEGITVMPNAIDIRKLSGDFTPQESALLQAVLAAYDGVSAINALQQTKQAAQNELSSNQFAQLNLSNIDAVIDGISNLNDLKTFLKRVVRYLIARR